MDNYGLSTADAAKSAAQHGTNELSKKQKPGLLSRYIASFGDPIIRILLIALGANILLMLRDANWYETAGIAVAVLLATLIATLSEHGSEAAFDKLQAEAAKVKCRVRRDGQLCQISISELVVGDIVHLQAGERVPADGEIIHGEVDADQSTLNGESKEAHKSPGGDASDFLSQSGVFRGSVITAGEGWMRISRVGDGTFYGKLAADIQEDTIVSPLKARLTRLAGVISRFGYGAAGFVVLANLFNSVVLANGFDAEYIMAHITDFRRIIGDVLNAATLGITVIVMAVPEGLPMMITVVLSANMRRMLRDNVLVRKLVGIETGGSLNILFTDKTGTLTQGHLQVVAVLDAFGNAIDEKSPVFPHTAMNCYYNNGAQLVTKKLRVRAVGGNSTDRALLTHIKKTAPNLPHCTKKIILPFNSREKFCVTEATGHGVYLKGAPEVLLPGCTHAFTADGARVKLENTAALKQMISARAARGMRLIALCEAPSAEAATARRGLTLTAIVGIRDEVRPEAFSALEHVTNAGVQIVMVTGDNRDTAVAVARTLGMLKPHEHERAVLSSAQMAQLTDAQLEKILPYLRVVARALPGDKGRLVRIAQNMGLVAGMTGDGVNDAPALKRADVGFTMGSGTEIAKEAGDIVILDDNFASIVKAILYGRTIFKSIRKFLIFQLTINVCAVGVSVIGPFIGVPVPVTVIQMLWINMIMDTLAGLAFAGEVPLREYLHEPPKRRNEPIINRYMFWQIATTGLFTVALSVAFLTSQTAFWFFREDTRYVLTAFFALFVFAGVFNSLNARTTRINLLAYISRNRAFIIVMGAVTALQLALIYFGGEIFRTTGLNLRELSLVVALASTVIVFDLARKFILRLRGDKGTV
jgi:calcium-translocating P-type ATPase